MVLCYVQESDFGRSSWASTVVRRSRGPGARRGFAVRSLFFCGGYVIVVEMIKLFLILGAFAGAGASDEVVLGTDEVVLGVQEDPINFPFCGG